MQLGEEGSSAQLVAVLSRIMETFRFYCRVARACVRRCVGTEAVLQEYCKLVS